MKKILLAFLACLFLIYLEGCKENERVYFDTRHTALNIWVGTQTSPVNETTFNFAYQNDMDSVVFYARLAGVTTDGDRSFMLEAVEGDTDKVEYVFSDYVIPGGGYIASFPIYFKKPANFNHFTETDGQIVFRLKANGDFVEGATGLNSITVVLRNKIGKPDNWDEEPGYPTYRELEYFFGTYSDVKYAFIIQATGLSNFKILGNGRTSDNPTDISWAEASYLNRKCRTALAEYNAVNSVPLTDEFDNVVTFPNR